MSMRGYILYADISAIVTLIGVKVYTIVHISNGIFCPYWGRYPPVDPQKPKLLA